MARATALIAFSCETIRRCSSSPCAGAWPTPLLDGGDGDARPLETTSSMSPLVTSWLPAAHVPVLAHDLQVLALGHLLVAEEGRASPPSVARSTTTRIFAENSGLRPPRRPASRSFTGCRLVEEVDGLVGQEAVGDVAARLVHGGFQRLVLVGHVMELLVAVLDPAEDLDRLLLGGRGDLHRPGSAAPASGPSRCTCGTRRGSWRRCTGSRRATAPASGCWPRPASPRPSRAHQGVELVDEDHDVVALGELPHDRLQRSSNCPRYLVPATISEMSRARMRFSAR
jgi:hypothetical protein